MARQGEREQEHSTRRRPRPVPSTIYNARGKVVWSGDWHRGKGSATARRLWSQMVEASGILAPQRRHGSGRLGA